MVLSQKTKMGRIAVKDLMWFITLFFFFNSPFLAQYSFIDFLYTFFKLLGLAYIVTHLSKVKFGTLTTLICLSEFALLYSTFRFGTLSISSVTETIVIIFFVLILDTMMKENSKRCVRIVYDLFEFLIYINFLSAMIFPNGLYNPLVYEGSKKYYFLGHQNAMMIYSLIGITLGEIRLETETSAFSRSRLWAIEAVSLLYAFRVWSATSILGTLAIICLNLYNKISMKGWRISLVWCMVASGFLFFVIAISQNLQFFSSFLSRVLHRESTLSGRTAIWRIALSAFLQEPIWGVGKGQGVALFGFQTAHNRYMNTLYTGGMVGMILLIAILWQVHKKTKKTSEPVNRLLILYFTVLMIIMQVETYQGIPFYTMLIVVNNAQMIAQPHIKESSTEHRKLATGALI